MPENTRKQKLNTQTVLFIKGVPRDLKAHFHAACAKSGKTMKDVILDFMSQVATQEYIDKLTGPKQ